MNAPCSNDRGRAADDVAASEWLELVKADEGNPLVTGANRLMVVGTGCAAN